MDLKGMTYYTDLLIAIAKTQGMKQDAAIEFAAKEKSNFSKMLTGERPLKYDYIIPLEKIFGVSLAKLLDEQSYFECIDKDDIPYLKSFRYYAYKDNPDLYEEMDKLYTIDGGSLINNSDEFNRFFLDYLIEYRAFNGLKHLVNNHGFRLNPVNDRLYQTNDSTMVFSSLPIQIAKFVIDSNDAELFNKVYDPFEYLMRFSYRDTDCLYTDETFIEAILNNSNIFNSLFIERKYPFDFINKGITPKDGNKPGIICVNPLLNVCLDYCLSNIEKYKGQATKILSFGITYNAKALKNLSVPQNECHLDTVGNLYIGWRCYYTNLIYTDVRNSGEPEIDKLIEKLPILKKGE
jgi:hypothetical protein